jgi:hypothetical protein
MQGIGRLAGDRYQTGPIGVPELAVAAARARELPPCRLDAPDRLVDLDRHASTLRRPPDLLGGSGRSPDIPSPPAQPRRRQSSAARQGRAEGEPRSGALDGRRPAEQPDVADASAPRDRARHRRSLGVRGCRGRAARPATRPLRRLRTGCLQDPSRRPPWAAARRCGRRAAWARTRCRRHATRARPGCRRRW